MIVHVNACDFQRDGIVGSLFEQNSAAAGAEFFEHEGDQREPGVADAVDEN